MSGTVTEIAEARRRRITPAGRALLGERELASSLSPYGPEPPSEELLQLMLTLPPSDRAELAKLLGVKAMEAAMRRWGAKEVGTMLVVKRTSSVLRGCTKPGRT